LDAILYLWESFLRIFDKKGGQSYAFFVTKGVFLEFRETFQMLKLRSETLDFPRKMKKVSKKT